MTSTELEAVGPIDCDRALGTGWIPWPVLIAEHSDFHKPLQHVAAVMLPGFQELQHQLLCPGLSDHFAATNCQTLSLHLVCVGRVPGCP